MNRKRILLPKSLTDILKDYPNDSGIKRMLIKVYKTEPTIDHLHKLWRKSLKRSKKHDIYIKSIYNKVIKTRPANKDGYHKLYIETRRGIMLCSISKDREFGGYTCSQYEADDESKMIRQEVITKFLDLQEVELGAELEFALRLRADSISFKLFGWMWKKIEAKLKDMYAKQKAPLRTVLTIEIDGFQYQILASNYQHGFVSFTWIGNANTNVIKI